MKRLYYTSVVLLMILYLSSCKNNKDMANFESGADMAMQGMDAKAPPPPPPPASMMLQGERDKSDTEPAVENLGSPVSRKIIRDGNMEIRVTDLTATKKYVDTLVKKFNGYYANESFNNTDYSRGFNLNIRIPSAGFDSFIAAIEKGSDEVAFKNISMNDVTQDYIDMETRIANKRNYLSRYAELLKQAKSVKDILEIQEKTRTIEEELESVEGRLRYMKNQIDYSTLNLQISKKNDYNIYNRNTGNFIDRLKMSLVKGWFGMVSFFLFLIRIWPFWIIVGVGYYFYRKIRRNRKKHN